jgi:hypothetical protein
MSAYASDEPAGTKDGLDDANFAPGESAAETVETGRVRD